MTREFSPTDEQRRTVRAMAGFGIPHTDIAIIIEIDPKTLRRHFRRELDRGSIEATTKVAQTLFNMATSGSNTAATIFWMKARAGWREKHDVQVSVDPYKSMTDAELNESLQELLAKAGLGPTALDPTRRDAMLLDHDPENDRDDC